MFTTEWRLEKRRRDASKACQDAILKNYYLGTGSDDICPCCCQNYVMSQIQSSKVEARQSCRYLMQPSLARRFVYYTWYRSCHAELHTDLVRRLCLLGKLLESVCTVVPALSCTSGTNTNMILSPFEVQKFYFTDRDARRACTRRQHRTWV